jgi:FMN phosphatase YigB (HAD superfamily)
VNVRKPNPRIFEYSLNQANAEKSESILIGDDWIADVKGAQISEWMLFSLMHFQKIKQKKV